MGVSVSCIIQSSISSTKCLGQLHKRFIDSVVFLHTRHSIPHFTRFNEAYLDNICRPSSGMVKNVTSTFFETLVVMDAT